MGVETVFPVASTSSFRPARSRRKSKSERCTCGFVVLLSAALPLTTAQVNSLGRRDVLPPRIPPLYTQGADGSWSETTDWHLNGRQGDDSIIVEDESYDASPTEIDVQPTLAEDNIATSVAATPTSTTTDRSTVQRNTFESWNARRDRTSVYAVPVIIALSVIIFSIIVFTLIASVTFKRKRRRHKGKDEESDLWSDKTSITSLDDVEDDAPASGIRKRTKKKVKMVRARMSRKFTKTSLLRASAVDSSFTSTLSRTSTRESENQVRAEADEAPHSAMSTVLSRSNSIHSSRSRSSDAPLASPINLVGSSVADEATHLPPPESVHQPPAYVGSSQTPAYAHNDIHAHLTPRQREKMPAHLVSEVNHRNMVRTGTTEPLLAPSTIGSVDDETMERRRMFSAHVATDDKTILETLRRRQESAPSDEQSAASVEESSESAPVIRTDADGFEIHDTDDLHEPPRSPIAVDPVFPLPPAPVQSSFLTSLAPSAPVLSPSAPFEAESNIEPTAPSLDLHFEDDEPSPSSSRMQDVIEASAPVAWLPIYEAEESSAPPLPSPTSQTSTTSSVLRQRKEHTVV